MATGRHNRFEYEKEVQAFGTFQCIYQRNRNANRTHYGQADTRGRGIGLDDKTFVYAKLKGYLKPIFAKQLVNGKLALFKMYKIKIIKAHSDAVLSNVEKSDKITVINKLQHQ